MSVDSPQSSSAEEVIHVYLTAFCMAEYFQSLEDRADVGTNVGKNPTQPTTYIIVLEDIVV